MRSREDNRFEVKVDDLDNALERVRPVIDEEDYKTLADGVEALAYLWAEIGRQGASIRNLRKLIFGPSSEKTKDVLERCGAGEGGDETTPGEGDAADDDPFSEEIGGEKGDESEKKKRKGHGRNGVSAYTGAERVDVAHDTLRHGDPCPVEGCNGRVYVQKKPRYELRLTGRSPIGAVIWALQRLRCALCGMIFTAQLPEGIGEQKHDESAVAIIASLRFGSGFPHNRLEKLQKGSGIPLPSANQWELLHKGSLEIEVVYEHLIFVAAQGTLLHNDDTPSKIIDLIKENKARKKALELAGDEGGSRKKDPEDRTGIYTSGVISVTAEGHRVALFFTGRKHAGENLARVLEKREESLPAPVHMCDGLSANSPGEFERIIANCLAHSRRKYVEVAEVFPAECKYMLENLKLVYRHDAEAREAALSPEERLRYHQEKSAPVMAELEKWLERQFEEKLVEPNSSLGAAIGYMQKRWEKLTRFLHVPGAPLDNNVVERALKKAILHRNNSRFYKTQNGARVGDLYMSLIHSAELAGVDPFDYLSELLRHSAELRECPGDWMPWNYRQTLDRIGSQGLPDG